MKSLQNKTSLATFALISAGILGGLAPVAAKLLLRELSPISLTFFRYTIAGLVLLPIVLRYAKAIVAHWKQLLFVSLFFVGNIYFFIFGIGHTTAAVSQLLYGVVPVFMLIEQAVVTNRTIRFQQLAGILIGVAGTLVIVLNPARATGLGTLYGNTLLLFAVLCWSLYLLVTKRISRTVAPIVITASTALATWVVSLAAMVTIEGNPLPAIASLSIVGWLMLLFVGIVLSIIMWHLYNFGITYGSTLVTSSIIYLNTVTAGVVGYLVFGEIITPSFLVGGVLLIGGVYLISKKHS